MTDVALSILALIAGGVTLELFRAAGSPAAYPELGRFALDILNHPVEGEAGNPS